MTPPIRAVRGEWWESSAGAIYCIEGTGWSPGARAACVTAWWITGHTPPQIHRARLYLGQWRALTSKGRRLDVPPMTRKGRDIRAEVAEVERRLMGGA